jgi:hypothetical protein
MSNTPKKLPQGFLFPFFSLIVRILHIFSAVELIKRVFNKNYQMSELQENEKEQSQTIDRLIADSFILIKWIYIGALIFFKWSGCINLWVVSYLLFFNLFTYFYYHVWHAEALKGTGFSVDRVRRRFINVLLAIAFSHLGFAYLYYVQFSHDFINSANNEFLHWFWFSASNAVAANYDAIKPLTCRGYHITMIQLFISFMFITIILSKSLPDADNAE